LTDALYIRVCVKHCGMANIKIKINSAGCAVPRKIRVRVRKRGFNVATGANNE